MKTAEILELNVTELAERIDTEKANLSRMKINHKVSPLENQSLIKKSRRDVARMMTVLRQKQQK
ncbi:MAG: 50S ribosomal protein L29 [Rikenellaceae bacterium]|jgi:large subunit ribosomal protein L29|nr:50S ribosomal protein L29 [Rikenellaceae bacterium]